MKTLDALSFSFHQPLISLKNHALSLTKLYSVSVCLFSSQEEELSKAMEYVEYLRRSLKLALISDESAERNPAVVQMLEAIAAQAEE